MQSRHALIVERHFTTNENVEDDTETPHVNFGPRICPCLQQLGSGEVETAAKGFEMAARREQVTQAKIDNLDVASLADEDVFDFQIAMHDTVPMTVIKSTGDLATEFAGLLLLEFAVGDDVVEHLATVDILKEHIPMVICADHIPHPADVRVVEKGDNGSFASSSDLLGLIRALLFRPTLVAIVGRATRDDFAGNLEVRHRVSRQCQKTKGIKLSIKGV